MTRAGALEDLHAAQLATECMHRETQVVELRGRLDCEESRLHRQERAAGGSHPFMMGCGISVIVLAVVGVIAGGCFIIWFVWAIGSAIGAGGIRC
jgi:hypothetical protein